MVNVIQENQFQVVQALIQRQDDALDELDSLIERVELAIRETIGTGEEEATQAPDSVSGVARIGTILNS